MAFSPQGNLLATDSLQGTNWIINIWRIGTTDRPFQITNSARPAVLKFSPDGTRLASLNRGGNVALWAVKDWTRLADIRVPKDFSDEGALDFSPDGQRLAIGDDGGRLRIVDVKTGRTNLTIAAHQELISAVSWSPQARILASGSAYLDGRIRLWDSTRATDRRTPGHTGWICQLIFSADSRLSTAASADQTIRLWDVDTKQCLATLRGSTDEVYSLALSPDTKTMASGCKDGVVAFWSALPPKEELLTRRSLPISGWYSFAPDGRSFVGRSTAPSGARVARLQGARVTGGTWNQCQLRDAFADGV